MRARGCQGLPFRRSTFLYQVRLCTAKRRASRHQLRSDHLVAERALFTSTRQGMYLTSVSHKQPMCRD